jgi:protein N-terminal methyltransferase
VTTVLGGYQCVSPIDVRESAAFLRKCFPAAAQPPGGPLRPLAAADLGAGVGRVTHHLLLRFFDTVDVFEPVQHFLDKARANITERPAPGRSVAFHCAPLQDFEPPPARYDVIWAQWCLGHLTEADLVRFFRRCQAGLKPGGLLVVKENNCAEGEELDEEDSSLTRSDDTFQALFARAGLRLLDTRRQKDFPAELYAVRMYALQ